MPREPSQGRPKGRRAEQLPDRSDPDTMDRDLSLDEKRADIQRLRDVAQALRRQGDRLEGLIDSSVRDTLQRDISLFASQIEEFADSNVAEVRRAIFAVTGDAENHRRFGGRYLGGKSGQTGEIRI